MGNGHYCILFIQIRSILFYRSQTTILFFLKYFIRVYFTSNFCISNALVYINPISLSKYPTLNYYLFKFDHNILSKIAFAVLNFFILFGYYFDWFGHWIINNISLYVCTKNALPNGN